MMQCPICFNEVKFFLKKDGYEYVRCFICGLVFVCPQPEDKHLREEVYSEKSGYQKHKKKKLMEAQEGSHARRVFNFLGGRGKGRRLLDVGCSSGEFLFFAEKRGFEAYGVELNPLTAGVARENGLKVVCGELKDARYQNNFFDVIFLGDIIEHIPNPKKFLSECRRILKTDGLLIISTPNLESFWARATFILFKLFSIPWSVLTPPHHLFQFSESNIKKFLKNNGFIHLAVWFRRPPTLRYELGSLHLWKRYKEKKTLKNFLFMVFSFIVYTKLYGIDLLVTPFKKKDFGMILISRKRG